MPYKPTEERRQLRLKQAKGWIEANQKDVSSNYSLNRLHVDAEKQLRDFANKRNEARRKDA